MGETDNTAFRNQRTVKRRLMEARSGAEVRRLQVVYFLSRKGCVEHPHLIRVHHLSKNGVRLRDIKRWLGELRGKAMPESFSWSYKRRYKTGYVWQDLLDDDLVTPISDNEYVLKGSEISSTANKTAKDNSSHTSSIYEPITKLPSYSEIEQYSSPTFGSESSTLTDDSGQKLELDKISGKIMQEAKPSTSHSTVVVSDETDKSKIKKVKIIASTSDKPHCAKSGASHKFRNFITCGNLNTDDSALVAKNKQNRTFLNMCSSHERNVHSAEILCRKGSSLVLGSNSSNSCDGVKYPAKKKDHDEFRGQRVHCAANYKPLNGPNCSQCGKQFKPEKLHAHMKQCKGMKALSNGSNNNAISAAAAAAAAAKNTSKTSMKSRNEDSFSTYLLSH